MDLLSTIYWDSTYNFFMKLFVFVFALKKKKRTEILQCKIYLLKTSVLYLQVKDHGNNFIVCYQKRKYKKKKNVLNVYISKVLLDRIKIIEIKSLLNDKLTQEDIRLINGEHFLC